MIICPNCGNETEEMAGRCSNCNAPIAAPGGTAPPQPPQGFAGARQGQPGQAPVTGQPGQPRQPGEGQAQQPGQGQAQQPGQGQHQQTGQFPQPGLKPGQGQVPTGADETRQFQAPQGYYNPRGPAYQQPYANYGYPQQTMQMPAQPGPGGYPQPYGQGPYPSPYGYPATQAQAYPYEEGKRGSIVLGILGILAGAAVIGSTWLGWVSASGFSMTGWEIMKGSQSTTGSGGFTLVSTGDGTIFFTGFFTLLLGALILIPSIVMFFRKRMGGVMTLAAGLAAGAIAAVNITMVFTKMQGGSPGVGLWMFAGGAVAALAIGIVGLASG